MELYQLVGLAAFIGMGYVVHSTMALNGLRKRMGVPKQMLNFRDIRVMRNPGEFEPEEVKRVRVNWIACAVLFALVLVLIVVSPEDAMDRLWRTQVG